MRAFVGKARSHKKNFRGLTIDMVITITAEDRENCDDYTSPCGCLLATAIRRQTGHNILGAGPEDVYFYSDNTKRFHETYLIKGGYLTVKNLYKEDAEFPVDITLRKV